MGCGTFFGILLVVASALFVCCSGFYWYCLGKFSGIPPIVTQLTAIDIVHAGMFVIVGVMGILSGLKIGFPPGAILTLVFLFIVAIGLTVEIGLVYTLYGCNANFNTTTLYSVPQGIMCGNPAFAAAPGQWFGYATYAIPFGISWICTICCLMAVICWNKDDGNFTFDD